MPPEIRIGDRVRCLGLQGRPAGRVLSFRFDGAWAQIELDGSRQLYVVRTSTLDLQPAQLSLPGMALRGGAEHR